MTEIRIRIVDGVVADVSWDGWVDAHVRAISALACKRLPDSGAPETIPDPVKAESGTEDPIPAAPEAPEAPTAPETPAG